MRNEFQQKADGILASACDAMREQGDIRWWLEAGTCLGFVREGDFIAHDNDIDIGVLFRDATQVASIVKSLTDRGFHQTHCFGPVDNGHEMSFVKDGVKLDVFFFYHDPVRDVTWHSAWKGSEQLHLDFPAYLFGWPRKVTFRGVECFVPDPPEEYLRLRYGDWRKTDRYWSWSEDPKCLRHKLKDAETKAEEWKRIHQPYELDFHKQEKDNFRFDDAAFTKSWDAVLGPYYAKMADGSILDIGGGSRTPLKGRGRYVACIEPLWEDFREAGLPPAWFEGVDGKAVPAEERIVSFVGAFDFVLCWNVLDHSYDWKRILENIEAYMKPDATFLLSTDCKPPCVGHPGVGDRSAFIETLSSMFDVRWLKTETWHRSVVAELGKRKV